MMKNVGGIEIVMKVIQEHINDAPICRHGCYILSILLKDDCNVAIKP